MAPAKPATPPAPPPPSREERPDAAPLPSSSLELLPDAPFPPEEPRTRYLLKVVNVVRDGAMQEAPFHHHSVAGFTFSRFTERPSPRGEIGPDDRVIWDRIPGTIAWLTETDVRAIKERLAQRWIEWRAGAKPTRFPSDPVVMIQRFRGVVRMVRPGSAPTPGWEPAANYLRIVPFPLTQDNPYPEA